MKLAHVNTALLIAILVVCTYIVALPFVPMVTFWVASKSNQATQLAAQLHPPKASVVAVPKDNRLIIPSMLLDTPIVEGKTIAALHSGAWRRPNTSTPDKGGNTVIAAHRFTYTNPHGVFYYLNKIYLGDEVGVFWNGKRYLYKVTSVSQVPPTQTAIEDNTDTAQLTLYTCTPLWLPKDRLVVVAILEAK